MSGPFPTIAIRRAMPWVVRAMAVCLTLESAYVLAILDAIHDPPPALAASLAYALMVSSLMQLGLFWSASARGRQRFFAALLMIPSGMTLVLSAAEEVSLMIGGRMHGPIVALTYLVGAGVYLWRFGTLVFPLTPGAARPRSTEGAS